MMVDNGAQLLMEEKETLYQNRSFYHTENWKGLLEFQTYYLFTSVSLLLFWWLYACLQARLLEMTGNLKDFQLRIF